MCVHSWSRRSLMYGFWIYTTAQSINLKIQLSRTKTTHLTKQCSFIRARHALTRNDSTITVRAHRRKVPSDFRSR
ncbi:hypothetical protein K503DRAFT_105378 [Rhizopogon vinicolor AM-OR11-026]|uniref:Uncharacterized protein n=1 Tax=Rhizopogon vinicolor AM-OR11-026 TaxID=1314800 RepID=A0A1B7N2S1_9AGAM|nr:hypothetical protein K503DRAFT_105378 [Rhizopogon vinicolor AM-OR11-026]